MSPPRHRSLQRVPVDSIVVPDRNMRFALSSKDEAHPNGTLEDIAESIRVDGLLKPLVVREREGKLELVAGYRRLAAIKMIGETEVDVVVLVGEISNLRAMQINLIENDIREQASVAEIAYRMLDIKHETRDSDEVVSIPEIAKKLHCSSARVQELLFIAERLVVKGAVAAFRAGRLSRVDAMRLARMDREAQALAWEIMGGEAVKVPGESPELPAPKPKEAKPRKARKHAEIAAVLALVPRLTKIKVGGSWEDANRDHVRAVLRWCAGETRSTIFEVEEEEEEGA